MDIKASFMSLVLRVLLQPKNSLYIIQFVTSIELLHVSELGRHPQGPTEHSLYPPKRRTHSKQSNFHVYR